VTVRHEADGWYVSFSCAEVPIQPLPPTGHETGTDVGLKVFLITAGGNVVNNPHPYRKGEKALKKAQQRVSRRKKGSNRRKKAVQLCAKKHQHVCRQQADFHHKTALVLVRRYDTIYVEAIQPANLSRRPAPIPDGNGAMRTTGPAASPASTRPFKTPDGANSCLFSPTRQHAPVSEWKRSTQRTPRRTAQAVERRCPKTSPCVPRLYALRPDAGPRSERGQEYPTARAAPSGSPRSGGGDEPRIRWALAHAESQSTLFSWKRASGA
jgi:hypothetical protein